jgi:hypothetical protein
MTGTGQVLQSGQTVTAYANQGEVVVISLPITTTVTISLPITAQGA